MSLILDALKQADSERARGPSPGASDPLLFDAGGQVHAPPTSRPERLVPAVAAVATVLTAAFAGYLAWPHTPWGARAIAPPAAEVQAQAAVPAAPPAPVASASGPTVAPAPVGSVLFRIPAPESRPPAAALEPPGTEAPLPSAALATPPQAAPRASLLPPYAAAPPVPAAAELPADVQAQLPAVNITGHTHSDNPTLRMLMIDGRMFVEGQAVAPGLRVERIGPHQAVFNHRGTRFGVDY